MNRFVGLVIAAVLSSAGMARADIVFSSSTFGGYIQMSSTAGFTSAINNLGASEFSFPSTPQTISGTLNLPNTNAGAGQSDVDSLQYLTSAAGTGFVGGLRSNMVGSFTYSNDSSTDANLSNNKTAVVSLGVLSGGTNYYDYASPDMFYGITNVQLSGILGAGDVIHDLSVSGVLEYAQNGQDSSAYTYSWTAPDITNPGAFSFNLMDNKFLGALPGGDYIDGYSLYFVIEKSGANSTTSISFDPGTEVVPAEVWSRFLNLAVSFWLAASGWAS